MKKIVLVITFCLFMVFDVYAEDMELNSKSAVLVDGDSGRVLYGKDETKKMPMASTTKIMTCIIALEYGKLDDVVITSKYAASMPDVQLNMQEGDKYKLGDLLYSLMLESHNDTAVAIAEHIGGSVEGFANLMNAKAKEIGAFDTNFVTPNGLDDDEHYTTAVDLAMIARYAEKNKKFVQITNTKTYQFSEMKSGRTYQVNNKNAFLDMMEGAYGVKTGFTGNAGYCFVGALKSQNKNLISVVLACGWPPSKKLKWQDTIKLMKYGADNYNYEIIYDSRDYAGKVNVRNGVEDQCEYVADGYENILIREGETIERNLEMPKMVEAPVEKNMLIGNVVIKIDGKEWKRYPVRAVRSVDKKNFQWEIQQMFTLFLLAFLRG